MSRRAALALVALAACAREPSATLLTPCGALIRGPEGAVSARAGSVAAEAPITLPPGEWEVEWTLADGTTVLQRVAVRDEAPPRITALPRVRAEAASPNGTTVPIAPPPASDACGLASVLREDVSPLPLGVSVVHFVATDRAGNRATIGVEVEVLDTRPPRVTAPGATLVHDGSACFRPAPAPPSADDDGYPASRLTSLIVAHQGPGAPRCWDPGRHTVTWRVSDPSGNAATRDQAIAVLPPGGEPLHARWLGLETAGGAAVLAGGWANGPVLARLDVRGGTPPYTLVFDPPADAIQGTAGVYTHEGYLPRVRVLVSDRAEQVMIEGHPFGVDLTPPSVRTATVPPGVVAGDPETYPLVTAPIDLSPWAATDAPSGVATFDLLLLDAGGAHLRYVWRSVGGPSARLAPGPMSFSISGLAGASFTLRAIAADAGGNTITADYPFRTVPPARSGTVADVRAAIAAAAPTCSVLSGAESALACAAILPAEASDRYLAAIEDAVDVLDGASSTCPLGDAAARLADLLLDDVEARTGTAARGRSPGEAVELYARTAFHRPELAAARAARGAYQAAWLAGLDAYRRGLLDLAALQLDPARAAARTQLAAALRDALRAAAALEARVPCGRSAIDLEALDVALRSSTAPDEAGDLLGDPAPPGCADALAAGSLAALPGCALRATDAIHPLDARWQATTGLLALSYAEIWLVEDRAFATTPGDVVPPPALAALGAALDAGDFTAVRESARALRCVYTVCP